MSDDEDASEITKSTRSTILNHTIASFYACYLLHSSSPTSRIKTYIGSTPNPPRRINQHNGVTTGGAVKTKWGRPWEMEVNVVGFPTKLSALQFEWAWQNPHASRHLHSSAPSTSTAKPVAQFPKMALSNRPLTKFQVLQFMLTAAPWSAMPLSIILYSARAQEWWTEALALGPEVRTEAGTRKWKKEREKHGGADDDPWGFARSARLKKVDILRRFEGVDGTRLVRQGLREEGQEGTKLVADDVLFASRHFEKFTAIIEKSHDQKCSLCTSPIDLDDIHSYLLCTSQPDCHSLFHLICLSQHFLRTPSVHLSVNAPPPLLPTQGKCPTCHTDAHWTDLIRGSFRIKDYIDNPPKPAKKTRAKGKKGKAIEAVPSSPSASSSSDLEDEEAEEIERSWARDNAADGSLDLEGGDDAPCDDYLMERASGDEDEAPLNFNFNSNPSKRLLPLPLSTTSTLIHSPMKTPARIAKKRKPEEVLYISSPSPSPKRVSSTSGTYREKSPSPTLSTSSSLASPSPAKVRAPISHTPNGDEDEGGTSDGDRDRMEVECLVIDDSEPERSIISASPVTEAVAAEVEQLGGGVRELILDSPNPKLPPSTRRSKTRELAPPSKIHVPPKKATAVYIEISGDSD